MISVFNVPERASQSTPPAPPAVPLTLRDYIMDIMRLLASPTVED